MKMKINRATKFHAAALALVLGTASYAIPARIYAQNNAQNSAQTGAQNSAQTSTPSPADSSTPVPTDQLLTSTVHDAWILSGKDETKFFDMVKTLVALSAEKRGITLPDSKEAGMRLGANIKRLAKADTDQLLYAVVDKAVMMSVHAKAVPAGTRAATPSAQ